LPSPSRRRLRHNVAHRLVSDACEYVRERTGEKPGCRSCGADIDRRIGWDGSDSQIAVFAISRVSRGPVSIRRSLDRSDACTASRMLFKLSIEWRTKAIAASDRAWRPNARRPAPLQLEGAQNAQQSFPGSPVFITVGAGERISRNAREIAYLSNRDVPLALRLMVLRIRRSIRGTPT
jgi:hypothetical protein